MNSDERCMICGSAFHKTLACQAGTQDLTIEQLQAELAKKDEEIKEFKKELVIVQSQRDADMMQVQSRIKLLEKLNWNNHVCIHHNDLQRATAIGVCPVCLQSEHDTLLKIRHQQEEALRKLMGENNTGPWKSRCAACGVQSSHGPLYHLKDCFANTALSNNPRSDLIVLSLEELEAMPCGCRSTCPCGEPDCTIDSDVYLNKCKRCLKIESVKKSQEKPREIMP